MFANVRNNEIIDFNSKYLNEDIERVETTDEMYQAWLENPLKVTYKDGEVILNPEYEEEVQRKERECLDKLSLTKREVFLAVYNDKGITPEQIRSQIKDEKALIEFDYANEYFRGNPLIEQLGLALGYTSEELDYLFENGVLPQKPDYDE